MSRRARIDARALGAQLGELERIVSECAPRLNELTGASGWTMAQQLHHTLSVVIAILDRLLSAGESPRQMDEGHASTRSSHPYFGSFSTRQWIRFVRVHTDHHLRIIEDIRQHLTRSP